MAKFRTYSTIARRSKKSERLETDPTYIVTISAHSTAYMQEKTDIDKAIATLDYGKRVNLRDKYEKYLEMLGY